MFTLRSLSIRDVALALKRGEVGLALRIGENLCSNVTNTVRFRLRKHIHSSSRFSSRRPS